MVYTLGVAGRPASDWECDPVSAKEELERQLRDVRHLIHEHQGWFLLRDAVRDVEDYAADGRLLVLERVEGGRKRVEGCVAYAQPLLQGFDPQSGQAIMRRPTMFRLLVVKESKDRSELALRLCLEAELRAAVRSMREDEDWPHSIGAYGVVLRSNEPALGWAQKLGPPRARIIVPTPRNMQRDATLALVHEFVERIRVSADSGEPYVLVLANRRTLIEAGALHYAGRLPGSGGTNDLSVYYDGAGGDPYQPWVDLAANNISWGNPVTLSRLGLTGPPKATIWGPPATAQMRLGDGRPWREGT